MIFTNLEDNLQNRSLSENIKKCIDFAVNNRLQDYSNGSHTIPDTDIKMNVMTYNTKDEEKGFWESHCKYIDVQVMLEGEELVAFNNIYNLEREEYKEADDFCSHKGPQMYNIHFRKNDVLVFFPEDGHMTGLKVKESKSIKKVVFKVAVDSI